MRCFHCHIEVASDVCPKCGVYLPSLLRDVLPAGTYLHKDGYHIADILGRGGFGITYQATHVALQDQVAIKEFYPLQYATRDSATGSLLIPADRQADFQRELQLFKEEGLCLKDIRHPGVVRVRDMFDEHETVYLVMDLVQGRTLRAELDAQPKRNLAQERIGSIVGQIVEALETIHQEHIYHLDIKPENVLLSPSGKVILVDFGAARRQVDPGTHRQFDLHYAAPELFTNQEVGPESDLFELGMLIHELLTGQRPKSALDSLLAQENLEISAEIGKPWRNLLARALVLQKELRPSSVKAWWETRWDSLPPVQLSAIPFPRLSSAFQAISSSQAPTPQVNTNVGRDFANTFAIVPDKEAIAETMPMAGDPLVFQSLPAFLSRPSEASIVISTPPVASPSPAIPPVPLTRPFASIPAPVVGEPFPSTFTGPDTPSFAPLPLPRMAVARRGQNRFFSKKILVVASLLLCLLLLALLIILLR